MPNIQNNSITSMQKLQVNMLSNVRDSSWCPHNNNLEKETINVKKHPEKSARNKKNKKHSEGSIYLNPSEMENKNYNQIQNQS